MRRVKWHSHTYESRNPLVLTLKKFKTPIFSSDERKKLKFWGAIVRLRAQIIYWALGLVREYGWSEEERMVKNGPGLVSKIQLGRLFEKGYLLEYDKYSSNMSSNDQSDLPWSSSDRDVHHEHTRRRGIQNIQGKSATTTLNALQLLFWPHLCGEDPWTVLSWLPQLTESQKGCLMEQVLK